MGPGQVPKVVAVSSFLARVQIMTTSVRRSFVEGFKRGFTKERIRAALTPSLVVDSFIGGAALASYHFGHPQHNNQRSFARAYATTVLLTLLPAMTLSRSVCVYILSDRHS
jgi:hypothetical protein